MARTAYSDCLLETEELGRSSIGRFAAGENNYFKPCNNGVYGKKGVDCTGDGQDDACMCGTNMEPTVELTTRDCTENSNCAAFGSSSSCVDIGDDGVGQCNAPHDSSIAVNIVQAKAYTDCADAGTTLPTRTYTLTICTDKHNNEGIFEFHVDGKTAKYGADIDLPSDPTGVCGGRRLGEDTYETALLHCTQFEDVNLENLNKPHNDPDHQAIKAKRINPTGGIINTKMYMHLREEVGADKKGLWAQPRLLEAADTLTVTVPDIITHTETQHTYTEVSRFDDNTVGFAAYIADDSNVRTRVSIDTYRYCSEDKTTGSCEEQDGAENTNEKAISLVYFGECGTFDGEVQLKRDTLTNSNTAGDFNLATDNVQLLDHGLGKEACYATPENRLSDSSSPWNIAANTDDTIAYQSIFLNEKIGNEYKTADELTGSFWGADVCSQLTGSDNIEVCNQKTGPASGKFFGGDKFYPGFRYVGDVGLAELQQSCHGVEIETSDDGNEKTTFKVAHEVLRPSQSETQYENAFKDPTDESLALVPAGDRNVQQTCHEKEFAVNINKQMRAVVTASSSQFLNFKVLKVETKECNAKTGGSASDRSICDSNGTNDQAKVNANYAAGCRCLSKGSDFGVEGYFAGKCIANVGGESSGNVYNACVPSIVALTHKWVPDAGYSQLLNCDSLGGAAAGNEADWYQLAVTLSIEFKDQDSYFKHTGLESVTIGEAGTNKFGIRVKNGNNIYKFGTSAENSGSSTVTLSSDNQRVKQTITIVTDCIDASQVNYATGENGKFCNEDAFSLSKDFSLDLRFRSCKNKQCLAGGTDNDQSKVLFGAGGEMSVLPGTCKDDCIDTQSGSTDLDFNDDSPYFPVSITVNKAGECIEDFSRRDALEDNVEGLATSSAVLFEGIYHPSRKAEFRKTLVLPKHQCIVFEEDGTTQALMNCIPGFEGSCSDTKTLGCDAITVDTDCPSGETCDICEPGYWGCFACAAENGHTETGECTPDEFSVKFQGGKKISFGTDNPVERFNNLFKMSADNKVKYGEGQSVVAALVADRDSARGGYTTWITKANICKFGNQADANDAVNAAASGGGTAGGCTDATVATKYTLVEDGVPFSYGVFDSGTDWFKVKSCKYDRWKAMGEYFGAHTDTFSKLKYALGTSPLSPHEANKCPDFYNTLGDSNSLFDSTQDDQTDHNCGRRCVGGTLNGFTCRDGDDCPAGVCTKADSCTSVNQPGSAQAGRGMPGAQFMCDWDLDAGEDGKCTGCTGGDAASNAAASAAAASAIQCTECGGTWVTDVGAQFTVADDLEANHNVWARAAWDAISFEADPLVSRDGESFWVIDLYGEMTDCASVYEPESMTSTRRLRNVMTLRNAEGEIPETAAYFTVEQAEVRATAEDDDSEEDTDEDSDDDEKEDAKAAKDDDDDNTVIIVVSVSVGVIALMIAAYLVFHNNGKRYEQATWGRGDMRRWGRVAKEEPQDKLISSYLYRKRRI